MNVFLYRKALYIPDKIAKRLHITIERPYLSLWEDSEHHFYLTNPAIIFKQGIFHGYFDCYLEEVGWKTVGLFPFPWEHDYSFLYYKYRVSYLTKGQKRKEIIDYAEKTKTLPTTRRRKTKQIQNVCNIEQTTNREDPYITNTLL